MTIIKKFRKQYIEWKFKRTISRAKNLDLRPCGMISEHELDFRLLDKEDQFRNDGYVYDSKTYSGGNLFVEGNANAIRISPDQLQSEFVEDEDPDYELKKSKEVENVLNQELKDKILKAEPSGMFGNISAVDVMLIGGLLLMALMAWMVI